MSSDGIAYRQLYEEGRKALQGIPDADLDARLLLEEVCGTSLQTLLISPDRPVGQQEADRYRSFLARRRQREPLAMIVGHTGFMGLDFRVTPDVLIPEQDTEILVENAIQTVQRNIHLRGTGSKIRLLDLCCGSGCIMLSLLHYLLPEKAASVSGKESSRENSWSREETDAPQMRGQNAPMSSLEISAFCCDISAPALAVAMENAQRLGWVPGKAEERSYTYPGTNWQLTFCQGDLFGALAHGGASCRPETVPGSITQPGPLPGDNGRETDLQTERGEGGFDLIVSNPPYIRDDVIPTLAPEVKNGEPYLALSGGADGLVFYRKIAEQAPGYLRRGGALLLEIGYDQAQPVQELLVQAGFCDITVRKDYGGNDRVVQCRTR